MNSEALGYVLFSSFMVESNTSESVWSYWLHRFPVPSIFRPPVGTKGTRITPAPKGDNLSILRRNKPIIILLRHRLDAFWRRLGQLLDKPPWDRTLVNFRNVCTSLEQTW